MRVKLPLMALVLTGCMLISISPKGLADDKEVVPVTLGNIQSFEIDNFHGDFPTERGVADAEIGEYAKTAILEHKLLPYASPGQAILHFDCGGFNCNVLKVSLTLGQDGPLLWQTQKLSRLGLYGFPRDPRKLAEWVVSELETAYQSSPRVEAEKIQIQLD